MRTKPTPSRAIDPPRLTVRVVADDHGVSIKTVYNWIAAGIIPAYKIGNVIRMRQSEVDAALIPVDAAVEPQRRYRRPPKPPGTATDEVTARRMAPID